MNSSINVITNKKKIAIVCNIIYVHRYNFQLLLNKNSYKNNVIIIFLINIQLILQSIEV